uniref:Cyclic nucleotide-binding domain-containing protein n=1 Tax=Elaeophora elaphi TaxID=1147741 RepID=A0A0R3RL01_9BILA
LFISDEKILIEKLPLKLQTDLALSVHYNTLSKVQLFQDCDRALLRELVLKLRPVIFLPDGMICKKGDVGKEMYIVNEGILQVVDSENSNKVFAELTEGSVFGEIRKLVSLLAIDGNNRRTANIRSKGYSTLFVLSKEDLNDVIKDYPNAQELLKRKAREMLKKDEKAKKTKVSLEKNMEIRSITAHIPTPRLMDTVMKAISSNPSIHK